MGNTNDWTTWLSLAATALTLLGTAISWWKYLGKKRVFSAWMIPTMLGRDKTLENLQRTYNDLGLSKLSELVRKDREYRLRQVYSREVTGQELASSVYLITFSIAIFLSLTAFVGSFFSDLFVTVLILSLVILGVGCTLAYALNKSSFPYWKRNVQKLGVEDPSNPLDVVYNTTTEGENYTE